MEWIKELFMGDSVAHSVMLMAIVIVLGMLLGKLKIGGISLGITFVLFVGILFGHCGFRIHSEVLHFFKEFGLILFVYSIGMQVGPGFFSSFRKGGITLNLLATAVVMLGVATTLAVHYITGIPIPTMVGILSGAVTNTPGLGAAQQAYFDTHGSADNTIAMGYAVAYPLGVVGVILSIIAIRYIFRVNSVVETRRLDDEDMTHSTEARPISLMVKNPALFGKTIAELSALLSHRDFVLSRIWYNESKHIEMVSGETVLHDSDKIFVITNDNDAEAVKTFIGEEIPMERKQWIRPESEFITRRILVTKSNLNGKRLGDLKLRKLYGINITRINRSGVDLVASPALNLQLGDRVNVVGTQSAIANVEKILGNS
ncbi:MAG: transporter, partial [Tannerella sp.]|nr:transporter [Tannerella sp.]